MGRKRKIINAQIDNNNEKNISINEVHNSNFMEVQQQSKISEVQKVDVLIDDHKSEWEVSGSGSDAGGSPDAGGSRDAGSSSDAVGSPDAGTIEDLEKMLKVHEDLNPEIKEVKAETTTPETEPEPEKNNSGAVGVDISMFITPRLIIIIYDTIYPKILSYVAKNFLKIDVNDNINLDDDQIELLEPIVAEMIKGVSMKMNPFTAFFICSNFFYVSKLMDKPQKNEYAEERPTPRKKKRGRPRKVIISNGL